FTRRPRVHHIHPAFELLAHDLCRRRPDPCLEGGLIPQLTPLFDVQHRHQIVWSWQATGVGREDSFCAALHFTLSSCEALFKLPESLIAQTIPFSKLSLQVQVSQGQVVGKSIQDNTLELGFFARATRSI